MLALPNRYVGTGHPDARRYTLTTPTSITVPSGGFQICSEPSVGEDSSDSSLHDTTRFALGSVEYDIPHSGRSEDGSAAMLPSPEHPISHWLPLLISLWSLAIMGFAHERAAVSRGRSQFSVRSTTTFQACLQDSLPLVHLLTTSGQILVPFTLLMAVIRHSSTLFLRDNY